MPALPQPCKYCGTPLFNYNNACHNAECLIKRSLPVQRPFVGRDLADYGFARLRDVMFDAVHRLWRRRQAEGTTIEQIAAKIERSPRWVREHLEAPGLWTLRTAGELIQGLDGEAEITVTGLEVPFVPPTPTPTPRPMEAIDV